MSHGRSLPSFQLPTFEKRYKKCLLKRMKNVPSHESMFIEYVLQYKHLYNSLHEHYRLKPHLKLLPLGRPPKRITSFLDNDNRTFFDQLCKFVLGQVISHSFVLLFLLTFFPFFSNSHFLLKTRLITGMIFNKTVGAI